MLRDATGHIYVTGSSWGNSPTNLDMVIWKYDSDGNLDSTFNSDGIVAHHNAADGEYKDYGYGIVLDSSGNIYVTGSSNGSDAGETTYLDMTIWKYSSTGILDNTFGSGGIVVHRSAAGGNVDDEGKSIVLDSDGNIYVTGHSGNGHDMVIWKYNSTGSLDNTFDSDGIVVHNGAAGENGYDYGYAVVLDSTDNVYVTGLSTNAAGNWDMVIWKYK
ncbi:MAG: SBBP repeat-containing protein [gamma proteobacterium symbiont of Lucinoma myriamae]|nr:SBBP repeat-containing protein [gamma proteobacterium symbiont of Lucinoma myriamae]MCU7819458.1 SBBP repeat-containing protein [gamma proteobacterium symbiont of Lucinoma myriamae]MCU7833307.1 SBBP repeat-containing protein [gamma proteobacterium symbiont of Lucinoma myriamae]